MRTALTNIAENTAERLFGTKNNIQFLAIDGTRSEDEALEMIIFYAGAFGYTGKLDFANNIGCTCNEPTALETFSISTAIPIHEENAIVKIGWSCWLATNTFYFALFVVLNAPLVIFAVFFVMFPAMVAFVTFLPPVELLICAATELTYIALATPAVLIITQLILR